MNVKTNPALYKSSFEKIENSHYFTEPWVTETLVPFIPDYVKQKIVWEPAAGGGDLALVLGNHGFDVVASDIDLSEFNHEICSCCEFDFMQAQTDWTRGETYGAIITNPPFAYEIVLTSRSRWDWWFEKEPWELTPSPRHNFSWFVWDQRWKGASTQFWAGKG